MICTRASAFVIGLLLVLAVARCGKATTTTAPSPTTTSPTATSPTTVAWASNLSTKGAVARQFTASQAGTVTVTLNSVSPSPGAVGLGVGIPQAGSGGCALAKTVEALPQTGVLISASVDPGVYCVKIYDLGTVVGSVSFSITLVHP